MAVDVTAFSALARSEFAKGMAAAYEKPYPAAMDPFTSRYDSKVKVETHTYMTNLPRLREFKGLSAAVRLMDKTYTVANKTYRAGPIAVEKNDLDDDQTGGYLASINALPGRAEKDIGHMVCAHLAAGTTNLCFDGSAFFANSHTFGSGDNLDTANYASNDAVTHKVVALITDNSALKPIIFQDREPLGTLDTDADTPAGRKLRSFEYWADTRFGLGYGYWWDGYHVTITDTPSVAECYSLVEQIINGFRSFTLPKGRDTDDTLYVHEGWEPKPQSFYLLCNLKLGIILKKALAISQYVASTGNVDNVYKDVATVVPTSALGA